MNIFKTLLVAAVSLSALQSLGSNPKFIWTGGGTPDVEGFFLWSDTRNWQDGKLPEVASAGGTNAGDYDFSAASANTKIKVDVSTSHHVHALNFGADQGVISLVQGNAADSWLRTFSNGSITVPAGTVVDFGLNCEENNDQREVSYADIMAGGELRFIMRKEKEK